MCWRIVRVTGDGSIKLVLYNYNGLTSTNNTPSSSTPCNVTGGDYALAKYEEDNSLSEFNVKYPDNTYVGFMYGIDNASSYADAQANTNPSTILTNLNKWYTNVISKQSSFDVSHLADTIWCNDKSVVTDSSFNPDSYTLGTNYGAGINFNYYGTAKRLIQASSSKAGGTGPSLICPNDNNGGKLSKFTVNDTKYGNGALTDYAKIGLLTADEIAFAGGAFNTNTKNLTYYLKQNIKSSTRWWTLSPSILNRPIIGVAANAFIVSNNNLIYVTVNSGNGVRPAISLTPSVQISSGNGTATNPYKIAV